jgi:hypothetical protein
MKKQLFFLFMLLAFAAHSQHPAPSRVASGLDVGFAFKKDNYVPSLTFAQVLHIGGKRLLSVGWTARLSKFHGDNLNFYTAPAKLTRGSTGFEALNLPIRAANLDTVRFDYVTHTALNVGIRAEIHLGPVDLGGSADVLGLALGKTRIGRVISSAGTFTRTDSGDDSTVYRFSGKNVQQRLKPTGINVRLLGDNDIGNLTADVYVRVRINQRLAIKGGYQWQTAEMYFRDIDPADNNKRFRHRVGMPYLAVSFPFFN